MKLLSEIVDVQDLEIIREGKGSDEIVKIKGPFLQAEVKNKNGRTYSKELCDREVEKFNKEKIQANRALGELDHPPTPMINLDRVSHKIEELVMKNNDGMGIAKLVDTPMGQIAKALVKEGIILGISTRGLGTVNSDNKVQENYSLITMDIVADPSAPKAFVNGVLENKEYIIQDNEIVEIAVNNLQKKVDKSKICLKFMLDFLNDIKSKNI